MSRFSQYNKNETYRDNLTYSNLQKERRNKEELQEIERDRIAMEKLQIDLDNEKKLEKERKNQIRQQQYEDYSNYIRQKYSEPPENREKLNIKLGGEQRYIRKPTYNQQMDNLCLNPTKQTKVIPNEPIQNFSEVGRNYHRGYSHGYNILTGEIYTPSNKMTPNKPNNTNFHEMNKFNDKKELALKNDYPKGNNNVNIEKEDLSEYKAYMEMKRKQEMEEMYSLNKQGYNEPNTNKMPKMNPPPIYDDYNKKPMENSQNPQIQSQQDEYPRNPQHEIPPEYLDMYLKERQKEEMQRRENPQMYNQMSPEEYDKKAPPQYENIQKNQPQEKEIPPEYKEMYMKEKEQLERQNEIPPEYKEQYMKEHMQRGGEYQNANEQNIPPEYQQMYNNQIKQDKIEEQNYYQQKMNNNIPYEEQNDYYNNQKLNYQQEGNLDNNNINVNKKAEEEYQQYLLSQQKNEKEKEDENMEIYQNMLKEKEKNDLEKGQDKDRQEYLNYLISQQNQNKDQNMDIISENKSKKPEIIEQDIQPNNSYQEYNNQKNLMGQVPPNYPPYTKEIPPSYPQPDNFEEQEQILNQQQNQMKELDNQNYINQQNEYFQQIPEKRSQYDNTKLEYLQNKQKNNLSRDNIFSKFEIPKPAPKYTNETLTKADRLRIQREYAQFLDTQINAKNLKNNMNKNNGLGPGISNNEYNTGPNPYQKLREKYNKLKEIPQDPYSIKNYNISSNSYLTSNPITNPINSYKFVDRRRVPSGRLQNNGSNIVGK